MHHPFVDESARPPTPVVPPPVAAPVRQSLRGLREALHLGRDLAQDAIERSPLPAPVSRLARSIFWEVDRVARQVEGIAVGVARDLLGEDPARPRPTVAEADRRFAASLGAALGDALAALGAADAAVDGAGLAALHARMPGEGDEAGRAALLAQGLVAEGIVGGAGPAGDAPAVAAFAAMLWWLSDRGRDPSGLRASLDLALALNGEVQDAFADPAALARLLAEWKDHV